MIFGIVKYFSLSSGHGMIAREDGMEDIVVHQTEVDRAGLGQLAPNQKLGFDIMDIGSKPKAINLWATFGNR